MKIGKRVCIRVCLCRSGASFTNCTSLQQTKIYSRTKVKTGRSWTGYSPKGMNCSPQQNNNLQNYFNNQSKVIIDVYGSLTDKTMLGLPLTPDWIKCGQKKHFCQQVAYGLVRCNSNQKITESSTLHISVLSTSKLKLYHWAFLFNDEQREFFGKSEPLLLQVY